MNPQDLIDLFKVVIVLILVFNLAKIVLDIWNWKSTSR